MLLLHRAHFSPLRSLLFTQVEGFWIVFVTMLLCIFVCSQPHHLLVLARLLVHEVVQGWQLAPHLSA